jgi:cell wall-associated NlpC family hydrolase
MGQLQGLDSSLEKAVEAYDLANVRLAGIQHDLRRNGFELNVARSNLSRAQKTLQERLVAVYTAGGSDSALEVLLGSTSLDDLLSRLETQSSVSSQDTLVVRQVLRFRTQINREKARLTRAKAQQAQIVRQRAAERASIQQQLAQRRALLSSIQGQITQMRAAEAARQAQLRREAEARLAQQQQTAAAQVIAPALPAAPSAGSSSGSSSPPPNTSPIAAPPPSSVGARAVGVAMQYLGVPYRWGGASPSGFDCSGLVMYAFAQVGVSLPHSSYAQYGMGSPVPRSDLQPGDLVFFDGLGHVGIYVGGGSFIHAPHTGTVVQISSLSGWYASAYVGARRIG